MLCYRDMTFCVFNKDCKEGKNCHRALTKKVEESAKKLRLDVCQFVDKPDCWRKK